MEQQAPEQSNPVRTRLLMAMQDGIFAHSERLPRESVLAEQLGISRTQLRDSLATLEREGFITRRHGVGTIINRHVLAVRTRMDIEVEFMDMIRQAGKEPGVAFIAAECVACGADVAERLKIEQGEMVLKVCRLVTADGKPAIYCEDHVPCGLIKRPSEEADFTRPIFDFLREFCRVEAYMDLTEIRPAVADAHLAQLLCVQEGAPLLYMDEVDYDSLAETLLPLVQDKLRDSGGMLGCVLSGSPEMAAAMARRALRAMSQEKKDELLVQLVTKNRGTLLQKGGELAEKNGIKLHLYDVSARKI